MAKQEKEKEKNNQKHFWKDFRAELKKVIWPTKKQLVNNTLVVIGMVLITTVIVLVLDLTFEALNTYGINKIRGVVQDSISTDNGEEGTNSEENNEEGNSEDENNSENTDSEENNESENADTNNESESTDSEENNEEQDAGSEDGQTSEEE